jgi:electron transfer flavoprotein alpha subunit
MLQKRSFDLGRKGVVEIFASSPPALASRVGVISSVRDAEETTSLTKADVIITSGRDLQKAENFKLIRELMLLVNGAVGARRSVVDEGRTPHSHQMGQTGKTVSPKFYVACGVSGAI